MLLLEFYKTTKLIYVNLFNKGRRNLIIYIISVYCGYIFIYNNFPPLLYVYADYGLGRI